MKVITTEDIHKWRDGFINRTPKVLEKAGQVFPVCFFLLADGKTNIAALQKGEFGNPAEKNAFANFIRKYCQGNDVVAMLFVCEGYMKTLRKDELEKYKGDLAKGMQVKDIEGSRECVYYCFETKLTSELMSQAIERDALGKKTLSPEIQRGMAERGTFVNLLGVPVAKN